MNIACENNISKLQNNPIKKKQWYSNLLILLNIFLIPFMKYTDVLFTYLLLCRCHYQGNLKNKYFIGLVSECRIFHGHYGRKCCNRQQTCCWSSSWDLKSYPQTGDREKERLLGMTCSFETLYFNSSDISPPTMPHLLFLPKWLNSWGTNVQLYESMEVICIHSNTMDKYKQLL